MAKSKVTLIEVISIDPAPQFFNKPYFINPDAVSYYTIDDSRDQVVFYGVRRVPTKKASINTDAFKKATKDIFIETPVYRFKDSGIKCFINVTNINYVWINGDEAMFVMANGEELFAQINYTERWLKEHGLL